MVLYHKEYFWYDIIAKSNKKYFEENTIWRRSNMNQYIEIKNLKKFYKDKCVLEIPELTLDKGGLYGIVGENGAGKTTLFRIIAKLAYPTEGSILYQQKNELKWGIMIEGPYLDSDLTARENLEWIQILNAKKDNKKIQEILEFVGLSETKDKKVKDFSLGMKQRLGLAGALIHNPAVLLLDEPMNGLDPNGIIEMRTIIKKLHKQGITIIIASHILDELDKLATDFIFIKKGKIVQKIDSAALEKKCEKQWEIATDHMEQTKEILEQQFQLKVVSNGNIWLVEHSNIDILTISRELLKNNIAFTHLCLRRKTLEEYYLELMEE